MAQFTKEEEARLKALNDAYRKRREEAEQEAIFKMTADQKLFVNMHIYNYYAETIQGLAEGKKLYDALKQGMKPSEYITKHMEWLYTSGYLPERYRDMLLWAADGVIERQYSVSWYRRALRTTDYSMHTVTLRSFIKGFHDSLDNDISTADALNQRGPEDAVGAMLYNPDARRGFLPETIAYAIDHGDPEVREAVIDILNGEGKYDIHSDVLRGVMRCHDPEMYEQVCKLLRAAKLQEGLRQAVCESADSGTAEAFRAVLKTITEENMIRFSSVKRAIGTWTGLVASDSKNLDRIGEKTLEQLNAVLGSEETRQRYLQSEDSMAIYMALWGYGFYAVEDAAAQIRQIANHGTHHQLLTAGYFLANLDQPAFAHQIAKQIVLTHCDAYDMMAVTLPHLMSDWRNGISTRQNGYRQFNATAPDWSFQSYFDGDAEAEQLFQTLAGLLEAVPKKELMFSPCIFPWFSVALTRSDIVRCMAVIAAILGDHEKIDAVVPMLPQVDTDVRSHVMRMLLWNPQTDVQRMALTEALCDKESYTRDAAYGIIQKMKLTEAQYRKMEEMLKYKAANARANLIALLLSQDDAALFASIQRLLGDKKEEKRTAGLDLIMQVCGDAKRTVLAEKCRKALGEFEAPTDKEQILLTQILGDTESAETAGEESLYTENDVYVPVVQESEYLTACIAVFQRYFPDSQAYSAQKKGVLQKLKEAVKKPEDCASYTEAVRMLNLLDAMMAQFKEREFSHHGETYTLDCANYCFYVLVGEDERRVPFYEDWERWYDESGCTPELLERMCTAIDGGHLRPELIDHLLGQGFSHLIHLNYSAQIRKVLNDLCDHKVGQRTNHADDMQAVSYAIVYWFLQHVPQEERLLEVKDRNGETEYVHFLDGGLLYHRIKALFWESAHEKEIFDLRAALEQSVRSDRRYKNYRRSYGISVTGLFPGLTDYVRMAWRGDIPEGVLFWWIFRNDGQLGNALGMLSEINGYVRDAGVQRAKRGSYYAWHASRVRGEVNDLVRLERGAAAEYTEEQEALLRYAADLFDRLIAVVLPVELHRGDTETKYSGCICRTQRIYGLDNFLAILKALGKDTLDRATYYYGHSKKTNLSYLLSVCIPNAEDNAVQLAAKLKGADITEQRLIEAALYAPEWLPMIMEYLGWAGFDSGCYYFMAHMNEHFDDRRRAMIAKYTPLTEEELNLGAFDIDWFRSAYETLGKKRFAQIYDAAKYISDGTKHSRARKYADAVQGKLDAEKTAAQIADKRNKDLVMAYALIPFADEDELSRRYLRIVQYRKEAKQFGAQRSASERKAADIALQNLAMNAGFSDVTRLTLRMETKLLDDSKVYFDGITVDEITVRLIVDADGKVSTEIMKNGKALKSIPAKYKKHAEIVALNDTKKKLTEQYRRTRDMMEQAMEEETVWRAEELGTLMQNPVAAPIIGRLVLEQNGRFGFLKDSQLVNPNGEAIPLNPEDALTVAHPHAMWKAGVWQAYQSHCFREHLVQPFRQVFRELYVKLPEEAEASRSLRYAGNQIQPAKTVACLKSRRWIADVEDGLQKVFYQENLVATIYALADWFSPADIEAPTLEYVAFYDRKTGAPKPISEVPDVLFSEVMRDVDLAVSVAHAGGVDPETSHSTVEMRAALLELSMPLLKMENVKIVGHHAHIAGKRAEYTVHLGSGVVHIKSGTMLSILPVHSQHRGRIFLPFADDDPKTAEILSKILLLSEDSKIKDPSILAQL